MPNRKKTGVVCACKAEEADKSGGRGLTKTVILERKYQRHFEERVLVVIICTVISFLLAGNATDENTTYAAARSTYTINDDNSRNKSGSIIYNVWYEHPLNGSTELLSSQKLSIASDGNSDEELRKSNTVTTKWTASLSLISGEELFHLTDASAYTTKNKDGQYQYLTYNCEIVIPPWYILGRAEKDAYGQNPLPPDDKNNARLRMASSEEMEGDTFQWASKGSSQIVKTGFSANICYYGIKGQGGKGDGKYHWTSGTEYNIYLSKPVCSATFNGNGGSPEAQTVSGVVGEQIPAPTVERPGLNFIGWEPAVGNFNISGSSYTATWKATDIGGNKSWKIDTHVKIDGKEKTATMQGLCGVGKRIYFLKSNSKNTSATLYTATIGSNNRINKKSVKIIKENIKGLKHANGMTAISKGGYHHLFVAPGASYKGYILHLKVKDKKLKNKKSKADVIRFPSEMANFAASGIASFNKGGTTYYILKNGRKQKIVAIDEVRSQMKYVSSFWLTDTRRDPVLSGQGSTCECDSRGCYYLPYSYAGTKEVEKRIRENAKKEGKAAKETDKIIKKYRKSWRKNSYIEVYKLDIKDNLKVEAFYAGTYKMTAEGSGRKIQWKKGKKKGYCVKFELEDIYINTNTNRMYFNSEGGPDCHDFLGSMGI